MVYFKYTDGSGYIACQETPKDTSNLISITQQEYDEYMASIQPTEEEIRAQKEALLRQLMLELYPVEEEVE